MVKRNWEERSFEYQSRYTSVEAAVAELETALESVNIKACSREYGLILYKCDDFVVASNENDHPTWRNSLRCNINETQRRLISAHYYASLALETLN